MYQAISSFCSPCLYKLPNALLAYDKVSKACSSVEKSINTTLSNRFNNLSDQVDKLSSRILEIQQEISKETTTYSNPDDQGLSEIADNAPQFKLSKAFSSMLSEEKEKDKRKLNLILHNIPESTNSISDVRKQDDTDTAAAIFNQHLGIPTSVTNATRLGKKGPKPKILRVTVSSERDKAIILRNCMKVRSITEADYLKNFFITPDMTPMEREQNKALCSRLREMNREGN